MKNKKPRSLSRILNPNIMSRELMQTLEQVAREKGLPLKVIVEAMVTAIELAARKRDKTRFDVQYDESTGTIRLYAIKEVVETVTDPKSEVSLEAARRIKPDAAIGDEVYLERSISELGRISAQKAKQIINQKVKEAEKQKVYDLYKDRVGDVVLAAVQRIDNGVIVNLGEAEAILPRREQIPGEYYKRGDKFRALITEVKMSTSGKWPQIVLSRTCDDFLMRLFEIEVPEISEGIVQIAGVARDPGIRAKIGVRSLDKNVDPVGACVGMRGSRIQSIVRELRGEKIDIIEWSDDPATLISRAITPAKVQASLVNEAERIVDIIVADDQLALAIGKRGQNAKLAVKLTTWKINITSESERKSAVQESFEKAFVQAGFGETEAEGESQQLPSPVSRKAGSQPNELLTLKGIGEKIAEHVMEAGFSSIEDIASSTVNVLSSIPGIGKKTAEKLLNMAREIVDSRETNKENSMDSNPNPQISEVVEDDR